jgi:hypothetical protein
MKSLWIFTLAWLMSASLGAQNINYVEYFWDEDPGVGNGIGTAIGPDELIETSLTIDPSGQAAGEHLLGVRTRTDAGVWSVPVIRRIVLHQYVEVEYFWNTDPGIGNGTQVAFETVDLNIDQEVEISSEGLPGGNHWLGMRVKRFGNQWGPVKWTRFRVSSEFSDGEYFWNTDPGVGLATPFDLPNDQDTLDATVAVSTVGLDAGWHNLYTRIRTTNGSFGPSTKKRVYVSRAIVGGEYFWDTDPGVGNGTPLGTLTIGTTAQVCDEVSTVGLEEGIHYLYVRSVSDDGVWSVPSRIQMTVTPNEVLVGCPGDFDRNGSINVSDLLIFLAGFGTSGDCTVDLNGDFNVNISDLLLFLTVFGNTCD